MPPLLVRALGVSLAVTTAAAAPSAAQFQLSFYNGVPATAPGLGGSFGGLTAFCTTLAPSINFPDAASFVTFVTANCPTGSVPTGFNGFAFGIRATGIFSAAVAGPRTFTGTTDDGNSFWVNGVRVRDSWGDQAGPYSFDATLTAGATNPFQLDYYANAFGTSFWTLALPTGVTVVQPTVGVVPEPETVALLATGLVALAFAARRRRAA